MTVVLVLAAGRLTGKASAIAPVRGREEHHEDLAADRIGERLGERVHGLRCATHALSIVEASSPTVSARRARGASA
jgi:hypothetical protein